MKTARSRLESDIQARLAELRALLTFAGLYNVEMRKEMETASRNLPLGSRRLLNELLTGTEANISDLCKELGPTQPLSFYVKWLGDVRISDDRYAFVPKWKLKTVFRRFESARRGTALLPEHTQISIDVHGISEPGSPPELRILEAALFEDMCALFNRAWELNPIAAKRPAPKPLLKESAAMRRSSVLAAFYVIEAYLNSIAFDYLVEHYKTPSPELNLIAEWDYAKGKQRLVAFRDKLIHYPRIILGLAHPPLQENNCPEIKYLLEESKGFRDAIVHANPRVDTPSVLDTKEVRFWRIGSATPIINSQTGEPIAADPNAAWLGIIDSAIAVIERIETLIHGNTERLFWVQRRTPDGPFGPSVFD